MVFDIYEIRNVNGIFSRYKRYAIVRGYDGKFLNWYDLDDRTDYGDKEINEQLNADGSVIVSKRQAELIVEKLGKMAARSKT